MSNILFVLYNDFCSNSAVHVHNFANYLTKLGQDCAVVTPGNKKTVAVLGENLYEAAEFNDINNLSKLFPNRKRPDIVHAWTPREVVRIYCEKLSKIFDYKLFIHLEDNEEHLLETFFNKPYKELVENHQNFNVEYLSHPTKYHHFLSMASGITIIIDRLAEFTPKDIPTTVLFPGANTNLFFPQQPCPKLRANLKIPLNSTVFCYTGNVHLANAQEVRSLYLAVSIMNREGNLTRLVRTGKDFCNFLGENDWWAKQYSIELDYIERQKLPNILALADILIQPGKPDQFNDYRFPSKLPEFLAMGKPVILPHTNIGKLIQHKKEAFVIPTVDALNIIKAVNEITDNATLFNQLSKGALNFSRKHLDWSKNSEKLNEFYHSV